MNRYRKLPQVHMLDNPLCFRRSFFQRYNLILKKVKILALFTTKSDKYEYLTSAEILPANHSQMREPSKFRKSLQKTTKETSCCFKVFKPFL